MGTEDKVHGIVAKPVLGQADLGAQAPELVPKEPGLIQKSE
jgi:hypothetical protein